MATKTEPQEESERKSEKTEGPPPADRVPEGAENMEHTLRRLVREKERQRAKNPGLYR